MVELSKLLTVNQCSRRTTLTEPQVRARINSGRLQSVELAGRILVHEDALAAFLSKSAQL